jgi:hypothetical protein
MAFNCAFIRGLVKLFSAQNKKNVSYHLCNSQKVIYFCTESVNLNG